LVSPRHLLVVQVPELLQAFAKFVAAAPDEMKVVGQVLATEHGARFQMLVCHCGDAVEWVIGLRDSLQPQPVRERHGCRDRVRHLSSPKAPAITG